MNIQPLSAPCWRRVGVKFHSLPSTSVGLHYHLRRYSLDLGRRKGLNSFFLGSCSFQRLGLYWTKTYEAILCQFLYLKTNPHLHQWSCSLPNVTWFLIGRGEDEWNNVHVWVNFKNMSHQLSLILFALYLQTYRKLSLEYFGTEGNCKNQGLCQFLSRFMDIYLHQTLVICVCASWLCVQIRIMFLRGGQFLTQIAAVGG